MIRAVIEATMGGLFRSLLYFYEAHAIPLDLIVLVYGLVMLMSWLNLVRIYRYLVVAVAKQIHLHPNLSAKSSVQKVGELIAIPWEEAVKASNFPLIGSQVGLLPLPKSAAAVEKIVDRTELLGHALDVLNGTSPFKIMPTYNMMWQKKVDQKKAAHKNAKH
jgi:hypothetical protein